MSGCRVSRSVAFWVGLGVWCCLGTAWAQSAPPAWPTDRSLSGRAFLPPGLLKLQDDAGSSPITVWLDKGRAAWSDSSQATSCQSCHSSPQSLREAVPTFPRLATAAGGTWVLTRLEDQILQCRTRHLRPGTTARRDEDDLLALSALLHDAARGLPIRPQAPPASEPAAGAVWEQRVTHGAQLFSTRMGRMNLACVHCHDQNIGKQMRIDVISPGHPTGFPVYRMSWQTLGSFERRLRACYSGVQAAIPPPGSPELRDLELFLKLRAQGMPLEGPSIRR